MTEIERQLHDQLIEAQGKYCYFIVAAALSAVAFAVHTTQQDVLSWIHLPFGAAVAAWAASAVCGVKGINNRTLILRLNIESLATRRGASEIHPANADMADEVIRERIQKLNKSNGKLSDAQWWLLILGGAFFIAGHAARMAHNFCLA